VDGLDLLGWDLYRPLRSAFEPISKFNGAPAVVEKH
jgi:hypothetical protein